MQMYTQRHNIIKTKITPTAIIAVKILPLRIDAPALLIGLTIESAKFSFVF